MKWVCKRILLHSDNDMPSSIPLVLVGFVDKMKTQNRIGRWYSSLKNDDGIPSLRVHIEVDENDEQTVLDKLHEFLTDNAGSIGWTGRYFDTDPTVNPDYVHQDEICLACELILELAKIYPDLNRGGDVNFWKDLKKKVQIDLPSMDSSHRAEYLHFLANNLAMTDTDTDFVSNLTI